MYLESSEHVFQFSVGISVDEVVNEMDLRTQVADARAHYHEQKHGQKIVHVPQETAPQVGLNSLANLLECLVYHVEFLAWREGCAQLLQTINCPWI